MEMGAFLYTLPAQITSDKSQLVSKTCDGFSIVKPSSVCTLVTSRSFFANGQGPNSPLLVQTRISMIRFTTEYTCKRPVTIPNFLGANSWDGFMASTHTVCHIASCKLL